MLKKYFLLSIFILSLQITDFSQKTFQNPVLGGDYPDPSIIRVGKDFYMTHSSFTYYPGLMVWHSTDLLNWERVSVALKKNVGSVWAPDLVKHNGKYYIYFPADRKNWVVWADSIKGPWSEPIDLNLPGFIDPGHAVGADGTRYLFLSKGYVVKLTPDGLAKADEPKFTYEGWKFPKDGQPNVFVWNRRKLQSKTAIFIKPLPKAAQQVRRLRIWSCRRAQNRRLDLGKIRRITRLCIPKAVPNAGGVKVTERS